MNAVDGLADLADSYDTLLVDVWGVLHEGSGIYPAARECLAQLGAADKPVILVSNAARRLDGLRAELRAAGLADDCYTDLVASGELTWRALAAGEIEFARNAKGYLFGPERSRGLCAGLSVEWCDDLERAGRGPSCSARRGGPRLCIAVKPLPGAAFPSSGK